MLLNNEFYKEHVERYTALTEIFLEILNNHITIKTERFKRNHSPFMNQKSHTAIMNKVNARKKCLKTDAPQNICNILYATEQKKIQYTKVVR